MGSIYRPLPGLWQIRFLGTATKDTQPTEWHLQSVVNTTPQKINMEHVLMEVWFGSFSFLFMGDGSRFQPLIFQGVLKPFFFGQYSQCSWCSWVICSFHVKSPGCSASGTVAVIKCSYKPYKWQKDCQTWGGNLGYFTLLRTGFRAHLVLGGGFRYFLFSLLFGEMIQFD